MNAKIRKAIKRQEKAINIFTQTVRNLTTTNKEMDDYLTELDGQANRINQEKEQAIGIIKENEVVITNVEALFGKQED